MTRKRKKTTALEFSVNKKKCSMNSTSDKINTCKKNISKFETELLSCIGPRHILKSKTLRKKIEEERQNMQDLINNTSEINMHRLMAEIDRIEKVEVPKSKDIKENIIDLKNRLYPPIQSKKNIFDSMENRDINKWKTLRSHKKRYAVMYNKDINQRTNSVDMCTKCGVDRIVDKESARSVCPQCGNCTIFASHIFDIKDVERDEGALTRQQSLSHMSKFSSQYERGFPAATENVLEQMFIKYSHTHIHDPAKVQSCRTAQLMKTCGDSIPKIYRRAPDRLSKELRCESIPEYTPQEINNLLNQRNKLRLPEEIKSNNTKHKKSFNNQIYMRQFGRANGMEISRLFLQAKTVKIHIERCRGLERECMIQQTKYDQPKSSFFGSDNLDEVVDNSSSSSSSSSSTSSTSPQQNKGFNTTHLSNGPTTWFLAPFS